MRLSGLAQVNVNIDKTGRDDESFGVECFVSVAMKLACRSNFRDATIFEQKIVFAFDVRSWIDEETVFDQQAVFISHAPSVIPSEARNPYSHEEPYASNFCPWMNRNSRVPSSLLRKLPGQGNSFMPP